VSAGPNENGPRSIIKIVCHQESDSRMLQVRMSPYFGVTSSSKQLMTQIEGIKIESTVHLIDMCCASWKRKYLVKMELKITLMRSYIIRAFKSRGKYFRVEKSIRNSTTHRRKIQLWPTDLVMGFSRTF
jgi:hypothetical protein